MPLEILELVFIGRVFIAVQHGAFRDGLEDELASVFLCDAGNDFGSRLTAPFDQRNDRML